MITALTIEKKFPDLKILNKKKIKRFLEITSPGIYRGGLELMGFTSSEKRKNIFIWGSKELAFFDNQNQPEVKQKVSNFFAQKPPVVILSVIISRKWEKLFLRSAEAHGVPIIKSKSLHASEITALMAGYLNESFAPKVIVHASMVVVGGVGVLLTGKSGVGKSEVVLDLIQSGEHFVADDATVVFRVGSRFYGQPPEITENILEARGLGLINVCETYGTKAVRKEAEVHMVVKLSASTEQDEFDRSGNTKMYYKILNGQLPMIQIPVRPGRNMGVLVRAAVQLYTNQGNQSVLKTVLERHKKKNCNAF